MLSKISLFSNYLISVEFVQLVMKWKILADFSMAVGIGFA